MKNDQLSIDCGWFETCNLSIKLTDAASDLLVTSVVVLIAGTAFLVHGVFCAVLARHEGRNVYLWFFIGVFTGVSGLLFLIGLMIYQKAFSAIDNGELYRTK